MLSFYMNYMIVSAIMQFISFCIGGARSIKNSLIKVHPNHTDVVVEFIAS